MKQSLFEGMPKIKRIPYLSTERLKMLFFQKSNLLTPSEEIAIARELDLRKHE
jgi:hypothetical protein